MIRRVDTRTPGDAPPAATASKLQPAADLQRLADHIGPAIEGDARQVRRAVSIALRVGLHHGDAGDLGLIAAVLAERVAEIDDRALTGLLGDIRAEIMRRIDAPAVLELPGGEG